MIFYNSESLGNDFFFFNLKFKNHKIIHRQLDIVLPCRYVTISLIQICQKIKNKKPSRTKCYHITTIELKDSQISMLCLKSQDHIIIWYLRIV